MSQPAHYASHPGVEFVVADTEFAATYDGGTRGLEEDLAAFGADNGWPITHTYAQDIEADSWKFVGYAVSPKSITAPTIDTERLYVARKAAPREDELPFEQLLGVLKLNHEPMRSYADRYRITISHWLVEKAFRSNDFGGYHNPEESDRKRNPRRLPSIGLALLEYALLDDQFFARTDAAWVEATILEMDNRTDNLLRHLGFRVSGSRSNRDDYDIVREHPQTAQHVTDPKFWWRTYRIRPQELQDNLSQNRRLAGRTDQA